MSRAELTVQAVIDRGRQAWKNIRRDQAFEDWLMVGRALLIGRGAAMAEAGKNTPQGKGYATAFGKWLSDNGFADMDKGDRTRLTHIMDHEAEVIAWRNTLTLTERLRLNHPTSVWRRFEAANRPIRPKLSPLARDLMAVTGGVAERRDEEVERLRETLEESLMGEHAEANARSILRQIRALRLPPEQAEMLIGATIAELQKQWK